MGARLWLGGMLLMAATAAVADTRVYPLGAPPAPVVDVVDVSKATASMRLAATMLQGLVNRGPRAHLYLLQDVDSDRFWLEQLKRKGYLKQSRDLTVPGLFAEYGKHYRKVFVYDPRLTGSMNAAVMLGALEDGLAVAPDDVGTLAGARPVEDLRGRWTSNSAAMGWAAQNLWPRMTHRMLAATTPQEGQSLYDYIVAHRIFTVWITGVAKSDGKGADHLSERIAVERVLAAAPVNIPVLGFWNGGEDPGITEYTGVGMAGETGQFQVVTSSSANLSLLSGIQVDWPAAVRRYQARLKQRQAPALRADRVYICLEFTESGDAPLYFQNVQWRQWQDPRRGEVPFNWNVGPAILELAPPIIEYFYDQATPNDYFYMALSGVGYSHPYRSMFSKVANREAAWRDYVGLTSTYMRRMGLRELQLYTDAWVPFDRARNDATTRRFVDGIPALRAVVLGMGRDEGRDAVNGNYALGRRGVLVSHCLTRWDVEFGSRTREQNIQWLVDDIRTHTPAGRPGFMHAMALSWAYNPSDHVEILRRLGADYVPVTLPEFVSLYRQARAPQHP